VTTDKGATWSLSVRVDDDTVPEDVCHADVFVQPGTNHCLVAPTAPHWVGDHIRRCAYLYRSTDRGLTFQPGVQLDTFDYNTAHPRVVADRDHIICDYFGEGWNSRDRIIAEARTFYTQPDTWGTPSPITNLDSLHRLYYSGTLALSADGRVHTALMIVVHGQENYLIYYASSSDHGVSWSDLELVNDDTAGDNHYPDIGADIAGHAYVVRKDASRGEIWFSTNNPAGVAESRLPQAPGVNLSAEPNVFSRTTTIGVSASSFIAHRSALSVYDASGRLVRTLAIRLSPCANRQSRSWNGCNDAGRRCAPGVYLIRAGGAVAKVVLLSVE
jgi:hypothetical protein